MQTCSNCGASNREGAKFCTTCGTRLNAAAAAGAGSWGALDTEETRVETPAVTTTTAEPTTTTSAPTWDAEPPVSTAWSWNQTRTSEELAVPADTTTEAPATSSWSNQWTSAEADDFGDDDELVTTTPAPVAVATTTTTTETPPTSPEPIEVTTTTTAEPTTTPAVVDNTTPVDDVIPVAAAVDDATSVPIEETAPITTGTSADASAIGSRARAQELIAELQALIDTGFPEPAADADNDTATALTALATIGDDDGSRFDGLRETVEKARTQPRDLDTMLALIGQVETISRLLDAYEAQRTAIAEALATLEG